jgi:uncharacterized membrane protein YkvA (DUF1232 family)
MVDFNKGKAEPAPRTLGSRSYGKSKAKAASYIQNKDKLSGLIDKATRKATGKQGKLKDVWSSLLAFFRLVRAYIKGSYRQVSMQSLLAIVASLIYFVSPIDLIPDFILGLGLIDDAAVLAWTIRACASDLASFLAWESAQGEPTRGVGNGSGQTG